VPIDTAPVIENGRTILPVRYIATPLGAQVLWNPKEQKVTLVGSKRVELWIGKPTARVDGVDVLIDPENPKVAPRIVSGRTMLPLRFISETFGATIVYDPKLQTVTVPWPRERKRRTWSGSRNLQQVCTPAGRQCQFRRADLALHGSTGKGWMT